MTFSTFDAANSEEAVQPGRQAVDGIAVPIADFYAGRSVFITGATGFLGKYYLEKLLYSCKDIDEVFVLIRNKKGENAEQRIKELLNKPLFSRLRAERPQDLKKVIPIVGDINHPELGISTEDQERIIQKVSVVFHVAATIKFQEELEVAFNLNVSGTKSVLNLCHRIKNIKVFVHVSTAYCNAVCGGGVIEERLYPPPAELVEVLKYLDGPHDDQQLQKLLNGRANTYTFTKALAEHYVAENHGNIPTVIIRPSIVTAALKEPLAGSVENWQGATGVVAACLKRINRIILTEADNVLDIIPVDFVSNLTIVAAARCHSGVDVYNSCTSSCNPLTFKKLAQSIVKYTEPKMSCTILPLVIITKNMLWFSILTFILQTVPAYIADIFLRMTGKQPRYVKIHTKTMACRDALNFFTINSWNIKADSTRLLHASLTPSDRVQFPFAPSDINWEEYLTTYYAGIERFLDSLMKVKDPLCKR